MFKFIREHLLIPFIVTLGLLVTLASSFALVLTVSPVQVLQPWSITTTKSDYVRGEQVTIHSVGVKRFKMPSVTATRSLVCTTGTKTNTYALPTSSNTSVKDGPFNMDVTVVIPLTLDSTPRSCKIDIKVVYPIYGFQAHGETNSFTVKE